MPAESPTYWTKAAVQALPDDGQRYELVWGELLVTPAPSPRHERVLMDLLEALLPYVRRHGLGRVYSSKAELSWGDDTRFQPDIMVVPPDEAHATRWEDVQHPTLVVEILSPSSTRYDRFPKRRAYQEAGVPLYWVVDPEGQQVEVWMPSLTFPVIERDRVTWNPAGASSPLLVDLALLFGTEQSA